MKNIYLFFFLLATAASTTAQRLYWVDGFLSRSWRTSEGFADIMEISPSVYDVKDFAIDPIGKHIYYAVSKDNSGDGTSAIVRTNLDGTGQQVIVPEAGAGRAQQLVLDMQHGMIYWTSGKYPDVSIRRSALDGSNPTVLIDLTGSNSPISIDLDAVGGKLYWVLGLSNTIYFANLDGSNPGSFAGADNQSESGYDLAVHPAEGKLYWLTDGAFSITSKMRKANLDGTGQEILADFGSKTPLGIAIDTANEKIYWSINDDNAILRSNLDGSDQETYVDLDDHLESFVIGDISDIAFDYATSSNVFDLTSSSKPCFDLYPNPVSNQTTTLEFSTTLLQGNGELQVKIYDAKGGLVAASKYEASEKIELNHQLRPGVYLVNCSQGDQSLGSKWLLVE